MHHQIRGWNECLITYVLAASSPTHAIDPAVYHNGFASGPAFKNGKTYYDIRLPLGPDYSLGGPLFFAHYSFLGLDPRRSQGRVRRLLGAKSRACSHQSRLLHRQSQRLSRLWRELLGADRERHRGRLHGPLAAKRPRGHLPDGGARFIPLCAGRVRRGARTLCGRPELWGEYGLEGRFFGRNTAGSRNRISRSTRGRSWSWSRIIAADCLWRLFMSCPEVQAGLKRLGFSSPNLTS